MSPEQMSRGIVNKQADMYSFGMTIYEVCQGNAFWHEFLSSLLRSSLALLRFLGQLMASPLLPWLEVSARLGQLTHISFNMASIDNDDLWSLITCCWSSDHDLRPTAADVALTLHRLLASQIESPPSPKLRFNHTQWLVFSALGFVLVAYLLHATTCGFTG